LSKYSNTSDLLSTKCNVRSGAAYASTPQTSCFYICELFTLLQQYKLYQLSYSKYLLLCTAQLNRNDVTLFVITFTHTYNHHIRRVNLINRLACSLVTRIYTRHSFSNIPEGSGDWQLANYVSSFDREDIAHGYCLSGILRLMSTLYVRFKMTHPRHVMYHTIIQ